MASHVTSGPWDSDLVIIAMKCVFVTVGTTSFDDLVASVLAPDCLQVSGGGRRVSSPLVPVAILGNLGQRPRYGRSAAALPQVPPPLRWLLPTPVWALPLLPAPQGPPTLPAPPPSSRAAPPQSFLWLLLPPHRPFPQSLRLCLLVLRLHPSFQRLRL